MLPAIFCAFLNKWLRFNIISYLLCLNHLSRAHNKSEKKHYTFVVPAIIAVMNINTCKLLFVYSYEPEVIFQHCFHALSFLQPCH